MYGVVVNYVCMSNFQLCYGPSTYLQTSVVWETVHAIHSMVTMGCAMRRTTYNKLVYIPNEYQWAPKENDGAT